MTARQVPNGGRAMASFLRSVARLALRCMVGVCCLVFIAVSLPVRLSPRMTDEQYNSKDGGSMEVRAGALFAAEER